MNGRVDDPFRGAPELLREGKWPAESDSITDRVTQRTEFLLRDVVALHALLEFDDVAQQLLDLVVLRFPAQHTLLFWYEDDGTLRIIGRAHADGACEARAREISHELLQQERSDSLLGDDASSSPFFLCVPLRCRGKKVGTVYLEDGQRQAAFPADDVDGLDLLARHAGVALANARVHERLQGEVRDLRGALRMSRGVTERRPDAPPAARVEPSVQLLSHLERDAILQALSQFRGNRTAAAQALGISVRKLQYKIKEYQGQGFDVPRS